MERAGWLFGLVGSVALHGVTFAVLRVPAGNPAPPPAPAVLPFDLADLPDEAPRGAAGATARATTPSSLLPRPSPGPLPRAAPEVRPSPAPRKDAVPEPPRPLASPASSVLPANPSPPEGDPGGGTRKPRISPQYAAILDGWFSARVALGGLDLPWEELSKLRARVSIQISPDRRVTSYTLASGSGHAAYDARVDAALRGVVASGAVLPEPPDGSDVPSQISLIFRCRSQDRCS